MVRKNVFKPLNVYAEDFEKVNALAKAMKMKKCVLMQKILEGVYDAGNEFIGQPNMGMLVDYRGNKCQIIFYGKSAIVFGTAGTDEEVAKQTEEQLNRMRDEENER